MNTNRNDTKQIAKLYVSVTFSEVVALVMLLLIFIFFLSCGVFVFGDGGGKLCARASFKL